jgi:hypothetical protein
MPKNIPDDFTLKLTQLVDNDVILEDDGIDAMRKERDSEPPIELPRGLSRRQALELLNNACCGD